MADCRKLTVLPPILIGTIKKNTEEKKGEPYSTGIRHYSQTTPGHGKQKGNLPFAFYFAAVTVWFGNDDVYRWVTEF